MACMNRNLNERIKRKTASIVFFTFELIRTFHTLFDAGELLTNFTYDDQNLNC